MTRKTILHVNRHHIAQNAKGENPPKPVFTAKNYKGNRKGQTFELVVDGRVVARGRSEWAGDGQLRCGARVWIEIIEGDGVDVNM